MKRGSLVEIVNDTWGTRVFRYHEVLPVKGKVYTVREIFNNPTFGMGILLEEISSHINPHVGKEQGFDITRFRELLPPMNVSIESLMEAEV